MNIRVTPFSFGLAAFIYEQIHIKVAPSTGGLLPVQPSSAEPIVATVGGSAHPLEG